MLGDTMDSASAIKDDCGFGHFDNNAIGIAYVKKFNGLFIDEVVVRAGVILR
jgi:hypothetical protein